MFSNIKKCINKFLFKEKKTIITINKSGNKEVNLIEFGKILLGFVPILLVLGASNQFSILLSINAIRYFSWGQVFSDSSIIAIVLSSIVFGIYVALLFFEFYSKITNWEIFISLLFFLIIILTPYFFRNNHYYTAWFFYSFYFGLGGLFYDIIFILKLKLPNKATDFFNVIKPFFIPIFLFFIPPIIILCFILYSSIENGFIVKSINTSNFAKTKSTDICGEIKYMNDQFIFLSGGIIIKNADNGDVVFLKDCMQDNKNIYKQPFSKPGIINYNKK